MNHNSCTTQCQK